MTTGLFLMSHNKVVGAIREVAGKKNKYTIVEEKNGWGRLKSGAGWISLSYTKKVAASTGTTFTPYLITTTYIIRCLVKGYNNTALTRQLSNAMIAAGLIISPDISKYLDYLQGAGYIEFTEEKVTAYNAYANDAVIKLTKEGVDLAEGTIEDNGVDI